MNKSGLIAAIAVPVVLAYPVSSWVLGKQVETALAEQYKQLESIPYVKVINRQYERGLFSSTEVVTFEIFGDMFRSIGKAQKEAAKGEAAEGEAAVSPAAGKPTTPPLEPLRFTVRSQIKHGPAPGLAAVAAASADSELVLDGKMQQELSKLLGDKKPLTAHTVYRFDGGGKTDVASPAFAADIPSENSEKASRLSWQGFTATVDFSKNMQSYSMTGEAPMLEILDGKAIEMVMTNLKFTGEQKRIFDDEPLLYSGTQRFTLAEIKVSDKNSEQAPAVLKQVAYDIALPVNGEFVDLVAKMGAESMQIGGQNYGPAHYDFSVKRLHARTIAKLYRAMLNMYSDPAFLTGTGEPHRALAPLAEPALELLKHNPELRIDRLSFKTAQGEASVAASARLKDAKAEDFANPMSLLAKLEASADLALPERLLGDMSAGAMQRGGQEAQSTPEMAAMKQQMLEQQLASFAQQGYITRTDGVVKSKIEFRNNKLAINGKPFDPLAMAGAAAPMPAEPTLEHLPSAPLPKH